VGGQLSPTAQQTWAWLALAVHGIGLYRIHIRWTPRVPYFAGLAPVLSLATLGLWWFDNAGVAFDNARFAWLVIIYGGRLPIVALRADVERGATGLLGGAGLLGALAHFLFLLLVLRAPARHAVGHDHIGTRRPVPGRRRALAHWRAPHDRCHRGAGASRRA